MKHKTGRFLSEAGMIAALYILLTLLSAAVGLSSGAIQLRLSEALCLLPIFTPAAIPGLAVGCFLANLFTGALPPDLLFGTLATLIGAVGTYFLRRHKLLALAAPILANTLILPPVLLYAYHLSRSYWFLVLTVGAGELLSCGLLGLLIEPRCRRLFKKHP